MPTYDKTPETFMELAFTPGTTEIARANFNVRVLKLKLKNLSIIIRAKL